MIRYGRNESNGWYVEGWTPWANLSVDGPTLAEAFRAFAAETEAAEARLKKEGSTDG